MKFSKMAMGAISLSAIGCQPPEITEPTKPTKPVAEITETKQLTKRPNIVLFLVDDMGWQDTSVPFWNKETPFNKRYRTPNMEKLATEGVKFTQGYACAVCSPTRVSLMTGLNAARHRVTNWTLYKNRSQDAGHRTLKFPKWNMNGITPVAGIPNAVHAKCLSAHLQEAGYRTIHAGKAHFGAMGTPAENPKAIGFDVNIAGHAAGGPGSYLGTKNFGNKTIGGHTKPWGIPGLEKYHGQDIFLSEALTLEANAAMDKAVEDDKPFFLYMSHYAVHVPLNPDNRFLQKYLDAGLDRREAMYAALVEGMDKSLGDIMENVKKHGLEDDTIIMFMSDNGGLSAHARGGKRHTHNKPLNSGKGSIYEGGIREPMIVKWPGVTKPNSVCNQYLIIEDFFPTILEMAGIAPVTQIGGVTDGISFVPQLKGEVATKPQTRALFWHYPNRWGASGPGIGSYSAIRKGDWKLIYYHDTQKYEMFNITNDIGETKNLAKSQPALRKKLAIELREYLKSVNAQMPTYKATGETVPLPEDENMKKRKSAQHQIVPLPVESKASLTDLKPRAHVVASKDWYSWCPSVIKGDDGLYHMFYSRWPKSISFYAWLTHTEVAHATATNPEGPYTDIGVAIPASSETRGGWFTAHNPKIKKFGDKYYIYFIQTKGEGMTEALRIKTARTGYSHPKWKEIRNNQRTFVAVADSINGPWHVSNKPIVEPAQTITTLTVNPAVCCGPDGTYFMIVKGDKPNEKRFIRNQALATSPTPTGPWTIQPKPVIDNLDTEDCSMWYDKTKGRFFAVFHAHTFIGMMTSINGYDWKKAPQYHLTGKTIPFSDGTTWRPDRMERPFIFTNEDGQPQCLFVACKKGNNSVNIILKLSNED